MVRGAELNRFEMQPFESLRAQGVDVVAIGAFRRHYDLRGLQLPVRELRLRAGRRGLPGRIARRVAPGAADPTKLARLSTALADRTVIHAAETFIGFSEQCARIARDTVRPLVLTCWENIPFQHERTPHLVERKRRVVAATTAFVAVTPEARTALELEGVPPAEITVIPAAVSLNRFSPRPDDGALRSQAGIADDDEVVLFVGRLIPEKGWEDLLLAVAAIWEKRSRPGIRLVLVGSGPDTALAGAMGRRLAVHHRLTLADQVPYDELPDWYRMADVVAAPSRSTPYWQEQFGMVLVEAMASGRPLITTRSGSIPSVVGDAAHLVEPYRPGQLVEAIERVLGSASYGEELGGRGRRLAEERYDASRVAVALRDLYRQVS